MRLTELQHHHARPVSDLDGEGTLRPFTGRECLITAAMILLAVTPLAVAKWKLRNPDEAQIQRQLEADERAMREARAAYQKLRMEMEEQQLRMQEMRASLR